MIAECIALRVILSHGRGTAAESNAAGTRPAGGTAAGAAATTANVGSNAPSAYADAAAADPTATRSTRNRWDRVTVSTTAVEHERVRSHRKLYLEAKTSGNTGRGDRDGRLRKD